jgi:FkbH-like protein
MTRTSDAYQAAEISMQIPPVATRGRTDENPKGIGFWALVAEDFATHERKLFEQGFWALFVHRFGNWRMGRPKIIRAPATVLYWIGFKLVEWLCGISLWYTVKVGRRVRIWHHSGMVLGARAIGNDVHLRQNVTLGVAQTGMNADLPILGDGVDVGAGACIAGAVHIGKNARIGANALVITDVPADTTVMGNPAQVYSVNAPQAAGEDQPLPAAARTTAVPETVREETLQIPRDMGVIAVLGSANLDYLAADMKTVAERYSLALETYVPPFGQAQMVLLQKEVLPDLSGRPAAALIVERSEEVLGEVYLAPLSLAGEDADAYLDTALSPMVDLVRAARKALEGPVFVTELAVLTRSTLGLADRQQARGLAALISQANAKLREALSDLADVHLLDTEALVAETGRDAAAPGQFWHLGRVPFSSAFNARLARRILGGLLALRGHSARIIVLDLDNTLWGGVLGEDGMEGLDIGPSAYPGSAYSAFQDALKGLTQRGIALAVASKNDEDLALQMLNEHPEMTLREADIVSHRIGWAEKSIGIQDMLDEIGLGSANAMFIDDNPVEREKARENVPGLIVPPFPDAPEDLQGWLLDSPYLEAMSLTSSDLKRTAQYKVRAREVTAKRAFKDIEDFYRDLKMTLTFEPYGPTNQQRILQLFAKTNQFNATLRRHDAQAVQTILETGGEVYAVGIADRHSAYELMGVIVLRPGDVMKAAYPDDATVQEVGQPGDWWVDSVLLSCRILGRTVENAIVAWATQQVAAKGAQELVGHVIEAPRNTPVRDLYRKSGMDPVETTQDLGQGGVYRYALTDGPQTLPDYFEVLKAPPPPEPVAARAPKSPKPPEQNLNMPAAGAARPRRTQPPANGAASLDSAKEDLLGRTFRAVLGLPAHDSIEDATMESLANWDSLAHLKLAMEIEQKMGLRLPAATLGQISSYAHLRQALAHVSREQVL